MGIGFRLMAPVLQPVPGHFSACPCPRRRVILFNKLFFSTQKALFQKHVSAKFIDFDYNAPIVIAFKHVENSSKNAANHIATTLFLLALFLLVLHVFQPHMPFALT